MKREIYFNATTHETRVVLLEDDLPVEHFLERKEAAGIVGNIYRGRVSNVFPGMQSAFVDIGLDRDVFLYAAEAVPPVGASTDLEGDELAGVTEVSHILPRVETILRPDQEVLVQVTKEALGGKAPRVTAQLSLPGRRLVWMPGTGHRAVSHRIQPEAERERLQELVSRIPGEGGFIVRTVAVGATADQLEEEANSLRQRWQEVGKRAEQAPVPSCVHREPSLALRVMRDLFTESIERVLIDNEETYCLCRDHAERILPSLAHRIERYTGNEPIFEKYGIQKELDRALRRRIWLPSGGYIVVHPTEALVAIDVNTGKYVGTRSFEETALKINLEATREIVHQIRLRGLGGILVLDFIDLEEESSRARLLAELGTELARDRARSRVLKISEFGLVEITRQRNRPSLEALLCRPCPTCRGTGNVLTVETLFLQIEREIEKITPLTEGAPIRVRVPPEVAERLQEAIVAGKGAPKAGPLSGVRVESVDSFHPEQYEILTD